MGLTTNILITILTSLPAIIISVATPIVTAGAQSPEDAIDRLGKVVKPWIHWTLLTLAVVLPTLGIWRTLATHDTVTHSTVLLISIQTGLLVFALMLFVLLWFFKRFRNVLFDVLNLVEEQQKVNKILDQRLDQLEKNGQ
ncbi:hypothetical protein QWY84_10685 [Aquisalimonas lutea]|uniref:hypothetical protein n=1 Tax=Aquisalimonas lutea TaxID=1327750 RepID=UPI0025B3A2F1|nr:hypothetical protein [Aquisalimonas lutea]MDN3518076.1 hypothetical protein [Aquisalimonas lutea]